MTHQGDYIIRDARESDVDALVAMRHRLLDHILRSNADLWPMSLERQAALPQAYRDYIAAGDTCVVVADRPGGDALVGMAVGHVAGVNDYIPPGSSKIFSVWVEPDDRRRGLCKAMMRRLIDWQRGRGVGKLVLEYTNGNSGAEATWHNMGFTPVYTTATAMLDDVWQAIADTQQPEKEQRKGA